MAADLSALSTFTTSATALSNLVLVSPQDVVGYQPQNPNNADGSPSTASPPPTFLFHYEGEQTAHLESDITDHYVEDNKAVQDQIALKPEVITTQGYIGELNNVPPKALALLKKAADKLGAISAYTPQLSATALLAYNEAFFLYEVAANAANSAVAAWSTITGSSGQSVIGSQGLTAETAQNRQQTAFQQFYGYWRSRTLFTVQTPWAVFQNMAIQSVRAVQGAETNVISTFEITFKMIRKATTLSVSGNGSAVSYSGQLKSQAAPTTDLGVSSPVPSIPLSSALSVAGVA